MQLEQTQLRHALHTMHTEQDANHCTLSLESSELLCKELLYNVEKLSRLRTGTYGGRNGPRTEEFIRMKNLYF